MTIPVSLFPKNMEQLSQIKNPKHTHTYNKKQKHKAKGKKKSFLITFLFWDIREYL